MTAKLFMNDNPAIIRTTDTIAQGAEQVMAEQRRELPVVDDEGRFQGMLTVDCLLYLVLPGYHGKRGWHRDGVPTPKTLQRLGML